MGLRSWGVKAWQKNWGGGFIYNDVGDGLRKMKKILTLGKKNSGKKKFRRKRVELTGQKAGGNFNQGKRIPERPRILGHFRKG